jgi:pimeloyl-ACP methyl ester carboxylesterase
MPQVEGVEHRYADVDNLRVHYAEAGSGEPLVLQHGWPQHWYCWRDLIGPLSQRFRVICPDLRGHGWTDAPPSGYLKSQMADDIIGLLDVLGIERTRYMGHDWGAFAGFIAVLKHPERFERFMPLSIPPPWPAPEPPSPKTLLNAWYQFLLASPILGALAVRNGFPARVLQAARKAGSFTPEEIRIYDETFKRPEYANATVQIYRSFLLHELRPLLGGQWNDHRLTVPTRLLLGASDPIGKSLNDRWREMADDMDVERIDGASHFLPEEKTELVLERALAFLP